jgi:signal-transduction protein with cAMP-binding, CBS, and nucleotidyltransferase domain
MATSQTAVFRHIVRDHMAPPPVQVALDEPAAVVVRRMAAERASAAVAVDGNRRLPGIATEQDVVRRYTDGAEPARAIMSMPVLSVGENEHLFEAVGFMRRHRLRHTPVVDVAGAVVGMLDLHDALAVAAGPLVNDIDRLTREDSLEGLADVKAAQVQLAEGLFADGVPAPEIQGLVADINNDIHARVLRLLEAELATEGMGPPPVPYACIVMGSGGRGESLLFPDQDHGFILADYPDERHDAIDPWFVKLARRMATSLTALHFPLCDGGVMASNPLWRKTLPQWRQQAAIWMRGRAPAMLLHCEILCDFRSVHGASELAAALRADITAAAACDRAFHCLMLELGAEHRAGIGFFGRLLTVRRPGKRQGELDLKLHGTLPLVEAVRLLALAHAIPATGTLVRLESLAAMGVVCADDADHLRSAFALLTGLQLKRQIADYRAGTPIGNFIDPQLLTERERGLLRDGLRAINELRARLRADLTGSLL